MSKSPTMPKDEANYRASLKRDRRCGNCSMYYEFFGGRIKRCSLVKGDIDPDYVCDHWERKQ